MLHSHGLTDCGRVRDHNEDSLVVEPERGLFAVCDGMGGHVGGEIASCIAAETLVEYICRHREGDWPFQRDTNLSENADLLRNALLLANQRIAERIEIEPWLARMGTTVVAAMVTEDGGVHLANVGDSRAYLWRDGALTQLTADHSWVSEQVRQGVLTAAEAERHPLKNVITRALGAARVDLGVDLLSLALRPGDALLLCSDGLTTMVDDAGIAGVLGRRQGGLDETCRRLVEVANGAGGQDNITVAVVELSSS